MPWFEQLNWVIYVLNVIIGASLGKYISTPGIAIEVRAVKFLGTYFQLLNWHSSLVGVQIKKSAVFLKRGWRVSSFGKI